MRASTTTASSTIADCDSVIVSWSRSRRRAWPTRMPWSQWSSNRQLWRSRCVRDDDDPDGETRGHRAGRRTHTGPTTMNPHWQRSRSARLALGALFPCLAALSAVAGAQAPPIERLRITPAARTVSVGDSLRLVVQALDARGTVVPGAIVRFAAQGGRFQGAVDSLGWVRAGSPGTVPIAVTAIVPGGRPIVEKVEVRITPGPAARIVMAPAVSTLLAGQR